MDSSMSITLNVATVEFFSGVSIVNIVIFVWRFQSRFSMRCFFSIFSLCFSLSLQICVRIATKLFNIQMKMCLCMWIIHRRSEKKWYKHRLMLRGPRYDETSKQVFKKQLAKHVDIYAILFYQLSFWLFTLR